MAAPKHPTNPRTFDADGNERFKRLRLDPDLADGQNWTIADCADKTLADNIQAWLDEAALGDEITVRVVALSDAECDRLPEI